jgi:hypothetical protein
MDDESRLIEERLAQLKLATQGIQSRIGFEQRVMLAVSQSGGIDWRMGLWRVGRYGLVVSFVAVALATVVALEGASRADEMQAMSYGTVDFEW